MTDNPPDYTTMSGAGRASRVGADPVTGGATVSLRILQRGPLSAAKAAILEHMGVPTRRVRDGKDSVLLHWDYLPR